MVKVAVFGTKQWVKSSFEEYNKSTNHELAFFDVTLSTKTAPLAAGCEAVCAFVNDDLSGEVIEKLSELGIKLIAMRCAGFDRVDLAKAEEKKITVVRVPAYSPHAVAEHAVALMMALNRKIHRAYNKVREGNFSIDGLLGFDIHGKTVGVAGTGQIGAIFAKILKLGFGANVIAYDVFQNKELLELGIPYVPLDELLQQSDVISLHVPLLKDTTHMINADTLKKMKPGVMIINTSRGGLIDTSAVIQALKSGHVAHLGIDVLEEEGNYFYEDMSGKILGDDKLSRLLTFPNVIITAHQAFFTKEAVNKIASTTLDNIKDFQAGNVKKENLVEKKK